MASKKAASTPKPTLDPKPAEPELVEGTADERAAASHRAALAGQEIQQVLAKHSCRLVPYLKPVEAIGTDGAKAIIEAAFGIIPDPLQQ